MSEPSTSVLRPRTAVPLVLVGVALWIVTAVIATDFLAPTEGIRWLGRASFFGGGIALALGLRHLTRPAARS